jgi:type II secretory pathway pseudopilin PulG
MNSAMAAGHRGCDRERRTAKLKDMFSEAMKSSLQTRRPRPSEEGYLLVAVILLLALLVLSLAVALPRVRESIQRDREIETMHRGQQYVRAIQLYYRKFGAYPPSVDALVKTNEIRFLRKRYIDPTTGKDDWKPIHFGQNKTPTAIGFFGQPLAGSTLAGTGPSGGNGIAGATTPGSGLNPTAGGASPFGPSSGPTDTSGASGASGASGTTGSLGAMGTSPTETGTGTSGSTFGGTGTGDQTFGGAGIIGFSPASPRQSILLYKKKNHYNEWEFSYDPISDRKMMGGGNTGTIGTPAGGISTGIGTPTGGAGTGPGGVAPVSPSNPSPQP